jgi:Domain of unknown function (DUF4405)
MKLNRDLVTPFLAFVFLAVGLSGIMMFFHLLDDFTNVVHEFLGLAFAVFAMLHVATNWKSIGSYSKRQKLFIPALIVFIVATALITAGKMHGNLERDLLNKLITSPVSNSFSVLGVDFRHAKATLQRNHIEVTDSLQSIDEISRKNKRTPEEIIELIVK